MFINSFLEKSKKYLSSIFFPLSIALVSFLIWITPVPYNWIFVTFYIVFSFFPLILKEGKTYIPLLLFSFISVNEGYTFTTIPVILITLLSAISISICTFIFIHKCRFAKGDLLIPLIGLIITLFISYIFNSIEMSTMISEGMLYILFLFLSVLAYIFLSTILGQGESITYLSWSLVSMCIIIYLQVFVFFVTNNYDLVTDNFNLGWSTNKDIATFFLLTSIPFIITLINQKKHFYLIPLFLNILFIILLASDAGILSLIFFIIPIVLLTFRGYKRIYPYISLSILTIFIVTFALLIIYNKSFNERVLSAIKTLLFFNEPNKVLNDLFKNSFEAVKANPYVGKSISFYIYTKSNLELLSSNTYLTTLVLGGSLSLIAYFFLDVSIFIRCLTKKEKGKYLFLLYLIMFEFIGLITNTLYNLQIFNFFLTCNCVYLMSNRPDDAIIHTGYIDNKMNLFN